MGSEPSVDVGDEGWLGGSHPADAFQSSEKSVIEM